MMHHVIRICVFSQLVTLLQRVKEANSGKLEGDLNRASRRTLDSTLDESLTKLGPLLSLGDIAKPSPIPLPTLRIDDQLDKILSGGREKISDSEEEGESYSGMRIDLVLTHKAQSNGAKVDSPPNASFPAKTPLPLSGQNDAKLSSGLSDLKSLPPLTTSSLLSTHKSPLLTSAKSLPLAAQGIGKSSSASKQLGLFDTELAESSGDDHEDNASAQWLMNAKENKNISLSQEVLSELSEEVSSFSEGGESEPLMNSDALRTIENLQLVSSEDDDHMGEDFNTMTETDYEKRKTQMEHEFQQRQIKPEDSNFVYDKQVDFDGGGKIESGWDSSDSSTSEF